MGTTIVRMALRCKILCCLLQRRSVQRVFVSKKLDDHDFRLQEPWSSHGRRFSIIVRDPWHACIYIYVQKNAHTPIYIDWDES